MKDKGFTLVELIVVIAVLSIIMLIGVPAFASIVERMKVRSDKASATEIGDAIVIREVDVEREKQLPYYPVITRFNDREAISTWAYENISWAVANGIMKGDDLNNVLPQKSATRAEVAAMFMNYKKAY